MLNRIPAIPAGMLELGSLPLFGALPPLPLPEAPAAILGPPAMPALVIVLAMKCAGGPRS